MERQIDGRSRLERQIDGVLERQIERVREAEMMEVQG